LSTLPQFDIQNILKRAQRLDVSPEFAPYSGIEILTGKQDSNGKDIVIAAPQDDAERNSGLVLTASSPWATQAQANNILQLIKGFSYQPFTAEGAHLDPAAELGDGVSVHDVYSGIYSMARRFGRLMDADISAPQSEDIDHEYPFETKANRAVSRRFTEVESELSIASDEISAKVSKKSPEGQTSFSWNLTNSAWVVKSGNNTIFRVDANGAQVAGKITATSGKIGGFDIGASAIYKDTSSINSGTKGVYLGTNGIRINGSSGAYFKATSSGDIEGNNLKLTGTLTIGGQSITAAALRGGAQSAYNNGGKWSTGAGYGYNYNDAINANSFSSGLSTRYLSVSSGMEFAGHTIGRTTIKDYNGVSRNVLWWQ